jgi:hypothetical protein
MAEVEWDVTPEQMVAALVDQYLDHVIQVIWLVCLKRAPDIEAWMKTNALWTDRTGNARQTLYTQVIPGLAETVILLSHGMDYGLWLEVAHGGRWAIVAPAIDYWTPIILNDIQAALGAGVVVSYT